ncbi:MAG: exosortase U [Fuerstia sp.]|nr:exosortase U [Fuerstiella sp.]
MSTEAQPTPITSKSTHTGWWIVLVVVAMVAMQYISTLVNSSSQLPGTARGDLVLQPDDLPREIHGWRQTGFEPAKPPEQLPERQYWWTHSWNYTNGTLNSIVAFDQATWMNWHDLTSCYQSSGWQVSKRDIVDENEIVGDWPCVVAEFQKDGNDRGYLLFSMFYDDGVPVDPRNSDYDRPDQDALGDRFKRRISQNEARSSGRSFQCQFFLRHRDDLAPEEKKQIMQLHLESREQFRNNWLQH